MKEKLLLFLFALLFFTTGSFSQGQCNQTFNLPSSNRWMEHDIPWPGTSAISSTSKLFTDNTGKIYFVGNDGYVYNYYFDTGLNRWNIWRLNNNQYALIDPRAGLTFDNGGRIFCVGTDKKAYNFYWSNNAWQFDWLNPNQYALIDARGGLIYDSNLSKLFCIGTDGKVYNFYWNNGWQFDWLKQSPYALANPIGGMAYDPWLNKIFIIATDGKVYNYYFMNNAWQFDLLTTNQYALANAAGKIAYDAALQKVYVICTNGKVGNFYYTGGWNFNLLNNNQYALINATGGMLLDAGKIYTIGTDGKVYNYYWNGSSWSFDWLVPNPYKLASASAGMTMRDGKVYIVSTDGKVGNYYWANNTWNFDVLVSNQSHTSNLSSGIAMPNGSTVFYADANGHLEHIYFAGSQVNYSDWQMDYDEEFGSGSTTTPLSTFMNSWHLGYPWGYNQEGHLLSHIELAPNMLSALSTSNQQLHLTANNIPVQTRVVSWQTDSYILSDGQPNLRWFNYSTGAVASNTAYTYGLYEISCRQPAGSGYWPAFWLTAAVGWPPEIDCFEGDGAMPNWESNNNVVTPTQGCFMFYNWNSGPDFTQGFHKFSLLWLPDHVTYYVDDVEIRTIYDDIPDVPMIPLIDLALRGGASGSYVNGTTPFPSSFDIDYIHIYSYHPHRMAAPGTMMSSPGESQLVIFPNPANDNVHISTTNNDSFKSIVIYDLSGQKVFENSPGEATELTFDISQLAAGVYIMQATTSEKVFTQKFIRN
jgi:beta-glucanase (GH16 family)